jgi:hypothetical protein
MTPEDLQAHVDELAAQPERWQHLVAFDTGRRHYVNLSRDDDTDVWLLCWNAVDDTGWHDHDISSGAVAVVAGVVRETTPRIAGDHIVTEYTEGQSFQFGPDRIHRMTGVGGGSVSIHAYSPPLVRMGQYVFDGDGAMRRMSVSYVEELRPLDTVAA